MADEIQVTGLAELREALLKKLPEAIQGKASQAALARAAAPIVNSAKSKAPTRFVGPLRPGERARGRLRDAITSTRSPESTKTYEARLVGVRRRAWYWRFIEFGRSAIVRDKGSLGNPFRGFFGKKVAAVPARPFMRPAFEENVGRVPEIYSKALLPAIERVAQDTYRKSLRSIRKNITGF